MFALLIGGGVVYLLLGNHTEALLLLLFASLSVGITLIQESRSENVLAALRNLASPRALVVRDGKRMLIAGREVVFDDLMVVSEGDRVAADARLVSAQDLLLDESLLTGESLPVRKLATEQSVSSESQNARPQPRWRRPALPLRRNAGDARQRPRTRQRNGNPQRNGQDRSRGWKPLPPNKPRLQRQIRGLVRVFAMIGRPGRTGRRRALRAAARIVAGSHVGRNRAGHVAASRRVPADPRCLHGHGRLAHFARASAHAPCLGD